MVQSITPEKAQELLSHETLDVVDVREPHEWSTGHLPGARLVPLAAFRNNPRAALGSDGVIFVCAAGVRSETAARLAVASGYRRIYNLSGGTRAWVRASLPLVKDEPAARPAA
jgi:rhodanese-related sulfurtransferase